MDRGTRIGLVAIVLFVLGFLWLYLNHIGLLNLPEAITLLVAEGSLAVLGYVVAKVREKPKFVEHYKLLRDQVITKFRETKIVHGTKYSNATRPFDDFTSLAPLFLEIKEPEIDYNNRQRMFQHLRSKKYEPRCNHFDSCATIVNKHNDDILKLLEEIDQTVELLIVKFPMFNEKTSTSSNAYYDSKRIKFAIQSSLTVFSEGNAIFAKREKPESNLLLAFNQDTILRDFFMGQIRAAILEYSKRLERLDYDANSARKDLALFCSFLDEVIDSIDHKQKLEGVCDVETGKKYPWL